MSQHFNKTLLFLAFAAPVNGAVLIATQDNNTLRSSADAIQSNGASVGLKEATGAQSNSRTGYFKFDATGLSPAIDGDTATLTLTTSANVGTLFSMRIYVLQTGVTGFDWTESTLTWNNSPALATTGSTYFLDETKVQLIGSTFDVADGTAAGTPITVSLTNWNNYLQSDSSLTFIAVVTDQIAGMPQLSIASSENTTEAWRPTLTIIPEPSTAGLGALASLGLLRRRRH